MPGKKSVSDPYSSWQAVTLEESGGYTGLRRGCHLQRDSLCAADAQRVAALLSRLGPAPAMKAHSAAQFPDQQCLHVELACQPGSETQAWDFDRADLPEAADELLALAPPLKPLPPPGA